MPIRNNKLFWIIGTILHLSYSSSVAQSHADHHSSSSADPHYPVRYGETTPQDVKQVLDRILNYLDEATPANIINRTTGKPITDYKKPNREAILQKGDYRITSHEWGVTYSGMLLVGEATADARFAAYTASRFKFLGETIPYFKNYATAFPAEANPMRPLLDPNSLDDAGSMCAAMIKGVRAGTSANLRSVIDNAIDFIMNKSNRLADGTFVRNRPLSNSLWLDDLYQGIPALAQMGKLTGEQKYFDEAVKQVLQYAERLFDKEKGIYTHGWVEGKQDYPSFNWARANGWAFMAVVELLDVVPESHPGRNAIMKLFLVHAKGLASCQSGEGLWHQLLDRNDSYLETSASAMYTFGLAHAINRGWLDVKAYGPIALLAWNAISARVNDKGHVVGTCVGTGLGFDPAFYYNRPVSAQGPHGYGPVLLAGAAMYTLLKENTFESNGPVIFLTK